MQTVLVTGFAGFLGDVIVRKLLSAGYNVRGLARGNYPQLVAQGVEQIRGTITDRSAVSIAVTGCDAVIHTAALAGVWGRWADYYAANTFGTSLLLEAAVKANCKAFVFTSSPSVTFAAQHQSGISEQTPYPLQWLSYYPHTKALAEQSVLATARAGAIWSCALRPHLIWGNGDPHLMPRVIARAKAGRLKRVGSGRNLIDTVHVENAADAHLLALERLLARDAAVNGEAFFITDGAPIECWEWITRILQSAGVDAPRGWLSYPRAYRLGAALELLYKAARIRTEPPMTRFVAAQLALDHYFSIDKARRLLAYQPQQQLETRLAECEPWLRTL